MFHALGIRRRELRGFLLPGSPALHLNLQNMAFRIALLKGESSSFWFAGQCSIHWATTARARESSIDPSLKKVGWEGMIVAEKLLLLSKQCCLFPCSDGLCQDLPPKPFQACRLSPCSRAGRGCEPHLGLCEGLLLCLLGSAHGVWERGGLPSATQSVTPVSGCVWWERNLQT